ncbi:MAG: hypothetical protein LUH05_04230 [Candidatus Gastranaerophilales bacterium]|nr:hypothetical protein [Candidatus Gastranaerophilales bacterium]
MQNYIGMPNPNYFYNPLMNAQQRLAQMEAQYPQYAAVNNNTASPNVKALFVMNKDEANAQQVALDGSITAFINKADNEIYTKGLGNNGLLEFKTYKLFIDENKNKDKNKEIPGETNEINEIKKEIDYIKKQIEEFKKDYYVKQQSDADISVNRTVKKQS